jgi:hypothetical protein
MKNNAGHPVLKWTGAGLGLCVFAIASWFGINATDEALYGYVNRRYVF